MPVLPSYRNQSLICIANQLTGFYMRATLAFNGFTFKECLFHKIKYANVLILKIKYVCWVVKDIWMISLQKWINIIQIEFIFYFPRRTKYKYSSMDVSSNIVELLPFIYYISIAKLFFFTCYNLCTILSALAWLRATKNGWWPVSFAFSEEI